MIQLLINTPESVSFLATTLKEIAFNGISKDISEIAISPPPGTDLSHYDVRISIDMPFFFKTPNGHKRIRLGFTVAFHGSKYLPAAYPIKSLKFIKDIPQEWDVAGSCDSFALASIRLIQNELDKYIDGKYDDIKPYAYKMCLYCGKFKLNAKT